MPGKGETKEILSNESRWTFKLKCCWVNSQAAVWEHWSYRKSQSIYSLSENVSITKYVLQCIWAWYWVKREFILCNWFCLLPCPGDSCQYNEMMSAVSFVRWSFVQEALDQDTQITFAVKDSMCHSSSMPFRQSSNQAAVYLIFLQKPKIHVQEWSVPSRLMQTLINGGSKMSLGHFKTEIRSSPVTYVHKPWFTTRDSNKECFINRVWSVSLQCSYVMCFAAGNCPDLVTVQTITCEWTKNRMLDFRHPEGKVVSNHQRFPKVSIHDWSLCPPLVRFLQSWLKVVYARSKAHQDENGDHQVHWHKPIQKMRHDCWTKGRQTHVGDD